MVKTLRVFEGRAWARELRALQGAIAGRKEPKLATERILAEHRADQPGEVRLVAVRPAVSDVW
jgi:hypothetical protein